MDKKLIAAAMALALMTVVFGWSMAMTAMGHAALIGGTAPVLGLTVVQVLRALRSRATTASGHRVAAVPDKEDGAP
ncbi:hypothetical protein ACWGDX_01230 [Streptomyces sp. NPDC055025]